VNAVLGAAKRRTFALGFPVSESGPAVGPSCALFVGIAREAMLAESEVLDLARRHGALA
jgi:hypothetical protein